MTSGVDVLGGWRAHVLRHFSREVAAVVPVTIAADPDRLLSDAALLGELGARGYDPFSLEDPIALRFVYESRYRGTSETGQDRSLLVVWGGGGSVEESVPWDILHGAREAGRVLNFALADLLPDLVSSVIRGVQGEELDRLFDAVARHRPGPLGANATADFVLRHVYAVAPELVKSPVDLLVLLLRRHHQGARLPSAIEDRLVSLLRKEATLHAWPVERLVSDRTAFLAFLQERWGRFVLTHLPSADTTGDRALPTDEWSVAGPADVPFDHPDMRAYVDTLFLDGLLAPTRVVGPAQVRGSWMAVGVATDSEGDHVERLRLLTEDARRNLPSVSASQREWLAFAYRWAEWSVQRWTLASSATERLIHELNDLHEEVERRFSEWCVGHYGALQALSYWPRAVMVHHIPHALAHGWRPDETSRRKALVLVDGLALSQWAIVKETLPSDLQLGADQGAAFAWVPTLTAVSRQAVFSGEAPLFFAASVLGGGREVALWRKFWDDRQRGGAAVEYILQGLGESDHDFVGKVADVANGPRLTVLGVVVGTVDRMIHGAAMGSYGLHCQTRDWGRGGAFGALLRALLTQGFDVTVTSDHGNLEARGIGKPAEGVLADERGERVRVFPDSATRASVAGRFPAAVSWAGAGLPQNYCPLIAPGRCAFVTEGAQVVTHGGLSLEEVIVPVISFKSGQP